MHSLSRRVARLEEATAAPFVLTEAIDRPPQETREQWLARTGLALILGGAAGNLIDRVALGYVIDFVDVYWSTWHFWAFNVADAAISVGVALMVIDMLGVGSRPASKPA